MTLDASRALDAGPFTARQQLIVAATALLVVVDGADNQFLANAVPAMMREWDLPRAAFANASAAAPLGMILGGLAGGILGDRIGRTKALLASVVAFSLLTGLIALVNDLTTLAVVRFLAGIGLGGAMPNAAALTAEVVPARQRPLAVTLTIVCIPVGGVLAGLVSAQILPAYGWRFLFAAGGVVSIVLAIGASRILPESPGFHAPAVAGGSVGGLFGPELRRDTLSLIGAFGSCLLAIWMAFLWIPSMLTDASVGFSIAQASSALSLFNFGGVAGAIAGALLIQRFGSRIALLGIAAAAVVSALALAVAPLDANAPLLAMTLFTVSGALLNAVQAPMYALAAHVFPPEIRSTGVGATVAVGRVGNVAASYVGSWALSAGGPPLYFSMWAAAMASVFVFLAMIRRHIPATAAKDLAAD
jgi:AAHS family 4-hydroxybenzoate transporter-like MFS transporter